MNEAMAIPKEMCPPGLDDAVTLISLSGRSTHELAKLAKQTQDVFTSIQRIADELFLRAIEKKTAKEFKEVRDEVFPIYFRLSCATSAVVQHSVPRDTLERLMNESCSEIEADFRNPDAVSRFGETIREQAIFTVWTLRKTAALLLVILAHRNVPDEKKQEDKEIGTQFSIMSAWAQFHLECLLAAIRFDTTIYPDVANPIIDGMRAAVNAYGLIRQGVDLRIPPTEPDVAPYKWDDEDQELLDSSMADVDSEHA